MSFGAGGLAQMTYNNHSGLNGNMGLPGSGLSSRGANMKRLTISAPSPNDEVAQAPKSSRAQLLSGLRTQKNSSSIPGTAPATQTQFPAARKPSPPAQQNHLAVPHTATASSFAQGSQNLNVPGLGPRGHHYTPSQVLSPPSITLESEEADGQVDPSYYEELVRMNQHLAQQQERLKQQLVAVTQQAQQMGLNPQQAQYYAQMMAQQAGLYPQQMQMQMPQQPMVDAVPGQPGLFILTDPMTGQQQYYFDQNSAMAYNMGMDLSEQGLSHSPPPATPTFNKTFEQPMQTQNHAKSHNWRSSSPPKHSGTPPTEEPMTLPPQSATAWRPGHKKTGSVMPSNGVTDASAKPVAASQGNFGPGQNREGEHPMRQPRGPPALDELTAKPTSKHEGSKNFASRQRRAALNNIISAGAARRSHSGSNPSLSPTSERDELVFSSAEDNDTASIRSGSSAQRAIGSEKKEREERESRERERKNSFEIETKSVSSDDGLVAVQSKMGSMGLDNKEKRRSALLGLKGATGQRLNMMF